MESINLTTDINEQSDSDWLIYTDNPNFIATPANGFPTVVVYNFDGDVFKVTVRWSK
jgi:hypothetical protein